MMNLLFVFDAKIRWETTIKSIIDCEINVDVISCNHEPSSIIGNIASKNIDGVFYCLDAEQEDTYETARNTLLDIRRLNPWLIIVLLSENNHESIQRLALECDVEWYLTNAADESLLKLLLLRIEKRAHSLKQRKEEQILSILINYIEDEGRVSYQNKFTLFQNYPKASNYQALIVKILPPYRRRTIVESDNIVILKGRELLSECLAEFNRTHIFEHRHDLVVVAAGEITNLVQIQDKMIDFLNEMNSFSQSVSSVATWVYMGIVVKSIQDLPLSYKSAYEIRDNRLLQNDSRIIVAKERTVGIQAHEDSQIQVFDVRKTLSNALATFDEQLVHKSLSQLKSNLISTAEVNGKTIFSIYKTLLSSLMRELESKEVDLSKQSIDYDYLIKEFEYFWNLDDVFSNLEKAYIVGVNELKSREEKNAPAQIVLAKRYIRSYFNMPLSLSELSSYVGMNENYFSEYFKKQTGVNFKEYQTDLRIRHSKQMLLDKQYSMDDISDAVGYKDTKYFSRVFKKITGISPGEYRKKYHVIND